MKLTYIRVIWNAVTQKPSQRPEIFLIPTHVGVVPES